MSRWRRAGYAALSGLTGWVVGQVACLPVNLIIAVRDTEGQAKLFVQTLLYGMLAWGAWTLLLAGRSSDQVGRRPVLATALGLSAASTVVFILAPSLGWLFVGRVLSGLSAGLATGTATATATSTAIPPATSP